MRPKWSGRLLGFTLLRPHNPFPTFAHTAELYHSLAPNHTGQGLGSRILAGLGAHRRECDTPFDIICMQDIALMIDDGLLMIVNRRRSV